MIFRTSSSAKAERAAISGDVPDDRTPRVEFVVATVGLVLSRSLAIASRTSCHGLLEGSVVRPQGTGGDRFIAMSVLIPVWTT